MGSLLTPTDFVTGTSVVVRMSVVSISSVGTLTCV